MPQNVPPDSPASSRVLRWLLRPEKSTHENPAIRMSAFLGTFSREPYAVWLSSSVLHPPAKEKEGDKENSRNSVFELGYIAEHETGVKVALDVGLLEGDDLRAEEVLDVQVAVEVFL